jgi:basic membrane protein A and related proteins
MVPHRPTDRLLAPRIDRRALVAGVATALSTRNVGAAQDASPVTTASPASEALRVAFLYVGPASELGYSWAHDQGRLALQQAIPGVETGYRENLPDVDQPEVELAIREFVDEGYDLIVGTSLGYAPAILAIAPDYPDTQFVQISGTETADNVSTAFGKIEEPLYVAGFVAGKMTESGAIGFVAAFPIPVVIRGINAFTLGAQAANPDVTVRVAWTDTWFDPATERAAAEMLLDQGADVIAQYQDTAAAQLAAQEAGKLGIGYNVDMSGLAPNAVLTSAVWNWGTYYIWAVEQIQTGAWTMNRYWGSWADGVVDLAPLADFVPDAVAAETTALADEFRLGALGMTDIFTGPILRQDGTKGVAAGDSMTNDEIWDMDWLVEGVEDSAAG